MRKTLLFVAILLTVLFFTNPPLVAHKEALERKELAGLTAGGLAASLPLLKSQVQRAVTQRIGRRDYGLFSLTTVSYTDDRPAATGELRSRTVGVGALDYVYVWRGI